jgi:flagellar M-ring protein FliF
LRNAGSALNPAAGGRAKELAAGQAASLAQPVLRPPEPIEADPERIRVQQVFDQVSDHLKREPTQSSRLLQSWIHSD